LFSFFLLFFSKNSLLDGSDCQTCTSLHISLESKDLDREWREWIIAEEKKRLALLAFLSTSGSLLAIALHVGIRTTPAPAVRHPDLGSEFSRDLAQG